MQPFTRHQGKAALLLRNNIDTDQIIPKQFLKKVGKEGYGSELFYDWRYETNGQMNAAFELNLPVNAGASILVTGNNFGCGSSREHAVWALAQFGFCVVIALKQPGSPGFADIFRSNAMKNGLLTIELETDDHSKIITWKTQNPQVEMTVDLVAQTITLAHQAISFHFPPTEKDRFLKGLDEISQTLLENEAAISQFEKTHLTWR